jgi:hypothetical protein
VSKAPGHGLLSGDWQTTLLGWHNKIHHVAVWYTQRVHVTSKLWVLAGSLYWLGNMDLQVLRSWWLTVRDPVWYIINRSI